MAEQDSNTIKPQNEKDWEWLGDLLDRAFWPLDGFIKLMEVYDDFAGFSLTLAALLDGAKRNLATVEEVVAQSFGGHIKVETMTLTTSGLYSRGDFGKAYIDPPKEPQAAAPKGFELDPVVRANLINDVEKLAGMTPELQLMAESICEDLGLPLPEAIKEKIAREKVARGAGGAA